MSHGIVLGKVSGVHKPPTHLSPRGIQNQSESNLLYNLEKKYRRLKSIHSSSFPRDTEHVQLTSADPEPESCMEVLAGGKQVNVRLLKMLANQAVEATLSRWERARCSDTMGCVEPGIAGLDDPSSERI